MVVPRSSRLLDIAQRISVQNVVSLTQLLGAMGSNRGQMSFQQIVDDDVNENETLAEVDQENVD